MLLRQKPIEGIEYIIADDALNLILQKNNFQPMYYFDNCFYYKATYLLKKFMEKVGE